MKEAHTICLSDHGFSLNQDFESFAKDVWLYVEAEVMIRAYDNPILIGRKGRILVPFFSLS